MPIYSTVQTQMGPPYLGKAVPVNDDHMIPNISWKMNIVAKAADYTVLPRESGTMFTTNNATSGVTFTLPAAEDGLIYWFINAFDGFLKVTADATNMVCYNNASADTVSFETGTEQIGHGFEIFSDGTNWYAGPFNGLVDGTMTVA